jgi:chemotaxis-related protein WspD
MNEPTRPALAELPAAGDCWNRIGVHGDGSCPELRKVVHCHNCPVFVAAGRDLFERRPPAEYVEEWTRRLARGEAEEAGETVPLLVFRLAEEWLGLDVRRAVEVAPARPARRIPHRSDRLLAGLVNIRGELHLCASLYELLGVEPPASPAPDRSRPRLLVVEHRQRRWVFAVDEVRGVSRLPLHELRPVAVTLARSLAHYTRGVFSLEGKDVGLLDEEQVFEALKRRVG